MKKLLFRIIQMSRHKTRLALAVCIFTVGFCAAYAATPQSREQAPAQSQSDDNEQFDVTTKDGYIYIYSVRRVSIQIYTILGQLIVRQDVQSGTTRIKAPSRGVYILRAGSITRRITVN